MKKTETETNNSQFTTVKTAYARVAVLLLAINFCLTGYVVYAMNSTMQDQIDGVTGVEQELAPVNVADKPQANQTDQADQTKD
jgi:predicted exporter